eukprot:7267784-Alexandrium_andersonii.AAC.1
MISGSARQFPRSSSTSQHFPALPSTSQHLPALPIAARRAGLRKTGSKNIAASNATPARQFTTFPPHCVTEGQRVAGKREPSAGVSG